MNGKRVGEDIASQVIAYIGISLAKISTGAPLNAAYNLAPVIPWGVNVYGRKTKCFSESTYITRLLFLCCFNLDHLCAVIFCGLFGIDLTTPLSSSTSSICTASNSMVLGRESWISPIEIIEERSVGIRNHYEHPIDLNKFSALSSRRRKSEPRNMGAKTSFSPLPSLIASGKE